MASDPRNALDEDITLIETTLQWLREARANSDENQAPRFSPCPFCGRDVSSVSQDKPNRTLVVIEPCGCRIVWGQAGD